MVRFQRRHPGGFSLILALCSLALLAGCGADKAFTPTVTSAPEQPTRIAATPSATEASGAAEKSNGSGVIDVSVILTDYRISSFTTAFEVGKTYVFTVANNGAVPHGFVIEPNGATNQPLTTGGKSAAIQIVNPGESQKLTWTFTTVGRLQIASHLNNDYAMGMVQTGLSAS